LTDQRREDIKENLTIFKRLLKWVSPMTHKDFAEKYIHLPKNNAFDAGRLVSFTKSPHLIKPMEMADNPKVQEIYLMFASQMAKTLFLFIVFAKNAKIDAKSCVWMIPIKDAISTYQQEKVNALVKESPEIAEVIEETRIEESRNSDKKGEIRHQGSMTKLIGSKVDMDKKGLSAKIIICDEVDEMAGMSAITPLWERAKTFIKVGAKLLVASTKKKKNGTITQGFNTCEQKNYLGIICPHCGTLVETHHSQFRITTEKEYKEIMGYSDEDFTENKIFEEYVPYACENAYYACNSCDAPITEEQKNSQILKGNIDWIVKGKLIDPVTVGFSANSFLSFFVPFEFIAREALKSELSKDPTERQKSKEKLWEGYYNEAFEPTSKETLKKNDILLLCNKLEDRELPDDTYEVYLNIDTQKDHFYWTLTAWRYGSNPHIVDYGRAESFDELDTIRKQMLITTEGEIKDINVVTIDRMGIKERTKEVDQWIIRVVEEEGRLDYIYATEGVSGIKPKMSTLYAMGRHPTDSNTIKVIKVNNLLTKDEAHNLITRGIEKAKAESGEDKYESAMFYKEKMLSITYKAQRLANEREEAGLKSIRTDLERMLSSEIKTYKIDENTGKMDDYESWIKREKGIRNDYWDTFVQSVAVWDMRKGALAQQPRKLTAHELRQMENNNRSQSYSAGFARKDYF
jgi:phage terminase large subunit GpA-like protein